MRYRILGKTGLTISEVGFGCWAIGGRDWGPVDDAQAITAIRRARDLGCTFFDTADVYGLGHSEELVARALAYERDKVIIASKVGNDFYHADLTTPGKPWPKNFSGEYITVAVEESLKRLKTGYIDLYQLHNPALDVIQRGEVFEVLGKLKAQGKIRFFGVSVGSTAEAMAVLKDGRPDTIQIVYNILAQEPALAVFPQAKKQNVGIIARVPLASGLLTGKYTKDTVFAENDHRGRRGREWLLDSVRKVEKLSFLVKGNVHTLAQAALAFVLSSDAVSVTIPGAKTEQQVDDNMAASALWPLPVADLKRLADFYKSDFR